jgi:hypothetical protein
MKNKKWIAGIVLLSGLFFFNTSCNKKEKGICYCTYYGGNRLQFDLRHLDRQSQKDTCAQISQNASAFAGSCKLK